MFFKKKKPFVRFVNLIPGVEISHPIIRANEYVFEWFREASKDYKTKLSNTDHYTPVVSTTRCPGLHGLFKTGFIVTTPIDFTITTDQTEPGTFEWGCPMYGNVNGQDYISGHSPTQLAKYTAFREDTLSSIIKVNTFWKINSSPDIVFLQVPISYPDHSLFTAATGVLNSCENYYEVNIQLFWHKLNGTHHVKAGTPLCQLIPVPKDFVVDLRVERMTEEDQYVSKAYEYLTRKEYNKNLKSFFTSCKKLLTRE
jgi:hypothetical protein